MLNSILIMLLSSSALADEGKFTLMPKGRVAPFKGVLFDEDATSHLLALPEKYKLQCDLDMEYSIDRLQTEYALEKKNLQLDIDYLNKQHELVLKSRDRQIDDLNKILKERNGVNKEWYLVGGVALGTLLTASLFAVWDRSREN